MSDLNEIVESIRKIVYSKKGDRFPTMSGNVEAGSVDSDAMTCSVQLSVDDTDTSTEGITLNAVLNNTGGVYGIPTDGANCIVAEVDGPGKWQLLWASSYVKWVIQASSLIKMKGGSCEINMTSTFSFKNSSGSFFDVLNDFMKVMGAAEAPAGTSGGPLITTAPVTLSNGVVPPGPVSGIIADLQTELSNLMS